MREGGGVDKGKKGNKKDKKECGRNNCIDGHFDISHYSSDKEKNK